MTDINARVKRRIDVEARLVLPGQRKFITGREIYDICLDELFGEYVSRKVEQHVAALLRVQTKQ